MTSRLKLLGGAVFLAFATIAATPAAQAADYVDPGCTLSGSVMAGFMFDWQEIDFNEGEDATDVDWTTPFGEGAGLVTCGAFNIQADTAYYAHSADEEGEDGDFDQTNSHIGGALFYRDPVNWSGGVQTSWISQDIFGSNVGVFRIGVFGEFYVGEAFTFGGGAAYYNSDFGADFDEDGFELAVYGRYYATPDFSLLLRGDVLLADTDFDGSDGDLDGFAVTGEAEYLVWDRGLSLLGGARYAERNHDFDEFVNVDVDDMQIFGGIKFYFGQDGTLVERQRSGTIDNTSLFKEKLPNLVFELRS